MGINPVRLIPPAIAVVTECATAPDVCVTKIRTGASAAINLGGALLIKVGEYYYSQPGLVEVVEENPDIFLQVEDDGEKKLPDALEPTLATGASTGPDDCLPFEIPADGRLEDRQMLFVQALVGKFMQNRLGLRMSGRGNLDEQIVHRMRTLINWVTIRAIASGGIVAQAITGAIPPAARNNPEVVVLLETLAAQQSISTANLTALLMEHPSLFPGVLPIYLATVMTALRDNPRDLRSAMQRLAERLYPGQNNRISRIMEYFDELKRDGEKKWCK